ncbi:beta-phosphoglucomutase [Pediococcus pentosaceus]|uniref:beta-phosphoglucomutase n=1 Tax=Pediococcus pentosaceus TaxID=1255 RepID=UPI001008FC5C|nr:beta-phosphoglucomutase [Pediococcus pentosaceus]RXI22279.1 beta-phosphoglucomutase [Pediococcus pentosaceus]
MKFSDIKGFAFDLDGVIADTAKFHSQAWHNIADQIKVPWTPTLAASLKGVSRMDSLELILESGNRQADFSLAEKQALAEQKNNEYQLLIAKLTPNDILPGIQAFLDELRQHDYRLVLASASKNAPGILEHLKVTEYFAAIVDPGLLKAGKPDPEIFEKAAQALHLPTNHVAGIEDSAAGIQSINAAGELSIGIGDLPEAQIQFDATNEVSLAGIRAQLD